MSILGHDPAGASQWIGDLPVRSRYTYGVAGERFFRAIKDQGVIFGTRCAACDLTYVPGRIFCERCMASLEDWQDVGTVGEVFTYTYLFVDKDGIPLDEPEIIAFVRIADGGLIHRLAEVEWEQIEFGMKVEAVFKSKKERVGAITDISHFRPV